MDLHVVPSQIRFCTFATYLYSKLPDLDVLKLVLTIYSLIAIFCFHYELYCRGCLDEEEEEEDEEEDDDSDWDEDDEEGELPPWVLHDVHRKPNRGRKFQSNHVDKKRRCLVRGGSVGVRYGGKTSWR